MFCWCWVQAPMLNKQHTHSTKQNKDLCTVNNICASPQFFSYPNVRDPKSWIENHYNSIFQYIPQRVAGGYYMKERKGDEGGWIAMIYIQYYDILRHTRIHPWIYRYIPQYQQSRPLVKENKHVSSIISQFKKHTKHLHHLWIERDRANNYDTLTLANGIRSKTMPLTYLCHPSLLSGKLSNITSK